MDDRGSRKRQTILDAAVAEFGRLGYEGTSMDRIAEVSGASKRTVYNHFPSKDALFQAVVDAYGAAMHGRKQVTYDPARPLEDQLAQFIAAELALWTDPVWKDFTRALLAMFLKDPGLARAQAVRHAADDPMEAWVRAAADDGRLAVADPALAAKVFAALVGGAFTWPAVYRGGLDPASPGALEDEVVQTFLGRYAGPGTRG